MNFMATILCLFFSFSSFAADQKPIAGKLVKTKHEKEGTNYFVVFTQDNKQYAYPVAEDSQVKDLSKFEGKLVKIYGDTEFKKSNRGEGQFIMFFKLKKLEEITSADIGITKRLAEDNEVADYLKMQKVKFIESTKSQKMTRPTGTISDKAANAAIFIGGAILAAEILGKTL